MNFGRTVFRGIAILLVFILHILLALLSWPLPWSAWFVPILTAFLYCIALIWCDSMIVALIVERIYDRDEYTCSDIPGKREVLSKEHDVCAALVRMIAVGVTTVPIVLVWRAAENAVTWSQENKTDLISAHIVWVGLVATLATLGALFGIVQLYERRRRRLLIEMLRISPIQTKAGGTDTIPPQDT